MKDLNSKLSWVVAFIGLIMLYVAYRWKNDDTDLDLIFSALGGLFIGGVLALKNIK